MDVAEQVSASHSHFWKKKYEAKFCNGWLRWILKNIIRSIRPIKFVTCLEKISLDLHEPSFSNLFFFRSHQKNWMIDFDYIRNFFLSDYHFNFSLSALNQKMFRTNRNIMEHI